MGIEWKTTSVEALVGGPDGIRLTVRWGEYSNPPTWSWKAVSYAKDLEIDEEGKAETMEAATLMAVMACEAASRRLAAKQSDAAQRAQGVADAIRRAVESK